MQQYYNTYKLNLKNKSYDLHTYMQIIYNISIRLYKYYNRRTSIIIVYVHAIQTKWN